MDKKGFRNRYNNSNQYFLTQAVATNGVPFEIKRQIESNPYAPMTEAEMLVKLEKSREQGMFRDADLVVSDMRVEVWIIRLF